MEVKGTAQESDGVFAVKERCVVCHNIYCYLYYHHVILQYGQF